MKQEAQAHANELSGCTSALLATLCADCLLSGAWNMNQGQGDLNWHTQHQACAAVRMGQ